MMIDKAMQKLGFCKVKENKNGVRYERVAKQGFIHVVCIVRKASGRHIFQSYDEEVMEVNGYYFNSVCGVEIPVLFLMWLKAKYLATKYAWEARADNV